MNTYKSRIVAAVLFVAVSVVLVVLSSCIAEPEKDVISNDTTIEDTTEVTTCEEVYVRVKEDVYSCPLEGYVAPELEPIEVLVKTSDGRVLVGLRLNEPYEAELLKQFEEKYKFDPEGYLEPKKFERETLPKLRELGCPQVAANLMRIKIISNWSSIECEMNVKNFNKVLADCGYSEDDKYDFGVFTLHVWEEDIEKIKNHELVKSVLTAESVLDLYSPVDEFG